MRLLQVEVMKQQGKFTINADFTVEHTGITALFGPSGAGKTSIVNMLAGLARPDKGRISLNGRCLFDSARGVDLPPEKRRVGYVFQDSRLFPHLSVCGNLCYGMRGLKKPGQYVQLDQVVDLLGIEKILNRRPARLSGGEKQRVAIGRALLCSPMLLLMDEPLASLDGDRKAEVMPFISRLAKDFAIPILYVSHIVEEIACLADYLVLLENGHVAAAERLEKTNRNGQFRRLLRVKTGGAIQGGQTQGPCDTGHDGATFID
jgi:molybdate transport system ATP-binding protein